MSLRSDLEALVARHEGAGVAQVATPALRELLAKPQRLYPQPGDIVSHAYNLDLDWREVHSVGLDWLMLVGVVGPDKPMGPFPLDNYIVERPREGRL